MCFKITCSSSCGRSSPPARPTLFQFFFDSQKVGKASHFFFFGCSSRSHRLGYPSSIHHQLPKPLLLLACRPVNCIYKQPGGNQSNKRDGPSLVAITRTASAVSIPDNQTIVLFFFRTFTVMPITASFSSRPPLQSLSNSKKALLRGTSSKVSRRCGLFSVRITLVCDSCEDSPRCIVFWFSVQNCRRSRSLSVPQTQGSLGSR